MNLKQKLEILSDAAKYDVSCSSSGSNRSSKKGQLGSTHNSGICHSFTPDGRCISLLKILFTNYCIYDCTYCINRHSNDVPRAAFTPQEVADLTINFYRRNYIEGLFLSSGIIQSPNHTMELLLQTVKILRNTYGFQGYIHLKAIPGADEFLIHEAGLYADRMSVNIELPSEDSLKLLAPNKNKTAILKPMKQIKNQILSTKENKKYFKNTPRFIPSGQSTQLIIGATPDTDFKILTLSENLYKRYDLKRVYYSAYTPVNEDKRLPKLISPPTLREHRLYQGDWLLRYYGFKANELLDEKQPHFDTYLDPKTFWALNHLDLFPVEINTAAYELLLRVPGIGVRGAKKIINSRKIGPLHYEDLKKLGIVLKRAQYFITCNTKYYSPTSFDRDSIYSRLTPGFETLMHNYTQLSLFTDSTLNTPILNPSSNPANSALTLSLLFNDSFSSLSGEL